MGFKAVEKSTPVFHRISMVGRQVFETITIALIVTSTVLAEVGFEAWEELSLGIRRYRQTGLSFGWHKRGSIGARPFPKSSVEPSGNFISIFVISMSSLEKGAASMSRAAMVQGFSVLSLDLEYRTLLEIAGSARKAFCGTTFRFP